MKICAIICEFNPFHNGHAYLLKKARELSGCDAVVLIMSGQFTQRGEICRTDKFLRAKHAVLSGADAVLELPAPFAVAPAEIFASGAVKLLAELTAKSPLRSAAKAVTRTTF
ncbi:MAG: nucleotidyltransferase family protein [Clostridia bacterium]|nr:nucleotidyltransferase family protein [Clostridia bacterium]